MATEKINLSHVRGFGLFMWEHPRNLEVIDKDALGVKFGDSIVNTSSKTVDIQG